MNRRPEVVMGPDMVHSLCNCLCLLDFIHHINDTDTILRTNDSNPGK